MQGSKGIWEGLGMFIFQWLSNLPVLGNICLYHTCFDKKLNNASTVTQGEILLISLSLSLSLIRTGIKKFSIFNFKRLVASLQLATA